ncbi:PAS domain S-box protein [Campylobacter coli]|nr:PAS domain-containing sensor histidine kinase [Campylobacter coli]EAL6156046.1 PAS domain S-box protein [Campylobacter coli]EAL9241521.1 PAS domain S-box protein [Campylobacter coli]EAL9447701.1 PAS domain S-box protein [Campylobacter coli]
MANSVAEQVLKVIEKKTIFFKINLQGIIIDASEKFCKISGYSKKELIGKHHFILKHPDVKESYINQLLGKLWQKEAYWVVFKNVDKLGKTFYLDAFLIPIVDNKGDLNEIIALSYDISNSFKLNEELVLNHAKLREISVNLEKTAKERKEEFAKLSKDFEYKLKVALEKNEKDTKKIYKEILNSSIEQMISDIAHQWRQPLNELGIAMFQMKQNVQDEKGFTEIYLQSKSTIKNMSETIDVFRTLFNKGVEQCVFIKETLNKALEIAFETIEKNHVNINIVSKSDYEVLAYENGLIRVFLNLILNSIEAFKNKKRKIITINFSKFGKNYLKITIKDNAGGIDKENLDKIFQPYFTTKHPSQGIGVGLYISRQIIESFQGKIKVKNGKDGACFEIFLKLKERVE